MDARRVTGLGSRKVRGSLRATSSLGPAGPAGGAMKPRCTHSIAGRAAVVAGLLLLTPPVARAQTHGTIVGTVTDAATGSPIAGVLVTATSPSLQGEQAVLTDDRGHYAITLLPPGRYRIAGHLQGYLPNERSGLALRVDYTLRANLVLAPEVVRA